ncbi:MAG: molybdopterin-dependent oxidoreductase [Nitrospirae bacterium]|nr:molybdopterin-dependent oxidoreductase [Nitrospirota bacterium]
MQTVEIWTRHTECIIIWGCNYSAAGIHHLRYILEAKERGVPVVVVDSYVTAVASKADIHLQPLPGTDTALALGMINYLVSSKLHDRDFIERHTHGFEELREAVKEWTLKRTASVTGVPADKIARVAELYATRHSMIECGYGHQRYTNGHQAQRAVSCLAAITGNVGKPGAHCNFMEVGAAYTGFLNSARVQSPANADIKKTRLISISHFGPALRAAGNPPIRAVISWRGALITQQPDVKGMLEAIRKLDLFVCLEQFMTDDARWADIVLPACTMFEQWGIHPSYRHQYLQVQVPVIGPLYESMPDIDFWCELGRRMGYKKYFPKGKTGLDWLKELLPRDFDIKQAMHPKGPVRMPERFCLPVPHMSGRFSTPTGKIELFSVMYEERGKKFPGEWSPLPVYYPPVESRAGDPKRARKYPLHLTSQHPPYRTHSQFYTIPYIYEIDGPPWVGMSRADAEARGIKDGDRVRVYNDRGEAHCTARVREHILKGVVELDSGYYVSTGANANMLMSPRAAGPRDVGAGIMQEYDFQLDGHTIPYNDCLVEIGKAEEV